jgi:hypothetical protein
VGGQRGAQERGLVVVRQRPGADESQGKTEGQRGSGTRGEQGKAPAPDHDLGNSSQVSQPQDAKERNEHRLGKGHPGKHQQPGGDDTADDRKLSALSGMAHVLHHPRGAASFRT